MSIGRHLVKAYSFVPADCCQLRTWVRVSVHEHKETPVNGEMQAIGECKGHSQFVQADSSGSVRDHNLLQDIVTSQRRIKCLGKGSSCKEAPKIDARAQMRR